MINISIIDNQDLGKVNRVVPFYKWETLDEWITISNWAPGIFKNRRNLKEFISTDLLVLDVDGGCSLEKAKEEFGYYKHIIATSKNHRKNKNGIITDRFRVILRLYKSIKDNETFTATWNWAQQKWPFIDPACKDSSRFYYPCIKIISVKEDGYVVDLVKPTPKPKLESTQPEAKTKKGELWKSTLSFLHFGADDGNWHHEFIKAAGNMREQGYSIDETTDMLSKITGHLDSTDEKQLQDIYTRELKYDYKPKVGSNPIFIKANSLVTETFEYLADKNKVKGEPTGLTGLDKLLGGGFRLGEITVLMAEAKTGKNTLYHYLMHKMLKRNISQGYASRELTPSTEVIPNLLSIEYGENFWITDINIQMIEMSKKSVDKWPLYFAPGYGYFPLEQIDQWIKALYEIGTKHFWMDHLNYMLEEEDYKAAGKLMRKLKALAKELDIHINLIVQPNKLFDGQRLSLNTIKGGAAVGQALDNLLILERVKDPNHKNISKLKLEVGRHKLCRLGNIYLQYDPLTTRFNEVVKQRVVDQAYDNPAINQAPVNKVGFKLPRLQTN